MNAAEMHYDFKQKLNKLDSQQNRNLLIPEIDTLLNEAQELFIKLIAQPRASQHLGFEVKQTTIDDIRSVVVPDATLTIADSIATLPTDYMYFVKAKAKIKKGQCPTVECTLTIRQHDDEFDNPFDESSYDWRVLNALFVNNGLKLFPKGFTVEQVLLSYIKKPRRIHFAQGYSVSGYTGLDGVVYTGTQSCELPNQTHSEIVDLAVLLASMNMEMQASQFKSSKINLLSIK